jgi:hypothetical protein
VHRRASRGRQPDFETDEEHAAARAEQVDEVTGARVGQGYLSGTGEIGGVGQARGTGAGLLGQAGAQQLIQRAGNYLRFPCPSDRCGEPGA